MSHNNQSNAAMQHKKIMVRYSLDITSGNMGVTISLNAKVLVPLDEIKADEPYGPYSICDLFRRPDSTDHFHRSLEPLCFRFHNESRDSR